VAFNARKDEKLAFNAVVLDKQPVNLEAISGALWAVEESSSVVVQNGRSTTRSCLFCTHGDEPSMAYVYAGAGSETKRMFFTRSAGTLRRAINRLKNNGLRIAKLFFTRSSQLGLPV
jgi:hypothetical protein